MTVVLRSCGVCGGHWSGYTTDGDMPGGASMWLCPKHRKIEAERWAAWTPAVNDRCFKISYPEGPFSDLLVAEIDGDEIGTRPLGFPDYIVRWYWRDELAPGRG